MNEVADNWLEINRIPPRDARDQLILTWLPFAIATAKRYQPRTSAYDSDERIAEAAYWLVRSYENFDASRGLSYGTYAGVVIRNNLLRYEAHFLSAVRVPRDQFETRASVADVDQITSEDQGIYEADARDLVGFILDLLDDRQRLIAEGLMEGLAHAEIAKSLPRKDGKGGVGVKAKQVGALKLEMVGEVLEALEKAS